MTNALSTAINFETVKFLEKARSPEISSLPQASFWLKISKHPWFMPYNRLAFLVIVFNVLALRTLTDGFIVSPFALPKQTVAAYVLANFSVANLIRQQYLINLLFKLATSVPTNFPLSIRWALGKIYHFGGIHVGAFLSGSLWLLLSTLQVGRESETNTETYLLLRIHLFILTVMIIMALPFIRARFHNQFELVARFGGWLSLLLFWIQAYLNPLLDLRIQAPILIALSVSIAVPWLKLKKVPVSILTPSSHVAITNFQYGVTPFAGSSTELSRNPLFEWHAFANVPYPGKKGFQLMISRAGDWTGKLIDDKPAHLWVKGIPTAGVGNIETLFKKVIWVATGSGIGPCVPHILANTVPSRLVWSTRTPHQTFGDELTKEILAVQPDAILWDTKKDGKADLVKLAFQAYKEFGAEAIICISNKKTTWKVVYELESRGIPAFGAIWDS